jgi:hypothetical protein
MSRYIPADISQRVREAAKNGCGYCLSIRRSIGRSTPTEINQHPGALPVGTTAPYSNPSINTFKSNAFNKLISNLPFDKNWE